MQKMSRGWWLKLAILVFLLFAISSGREIKVRVEHFHPQPVYNHTLARILVEYASAVYISDLTELFTWTCSRCNDLTEGFEMIELIVDVKRCLQGFVGVAKDINAIVIAFRGTQESSIQNWIDDLFWKQLDFYYPGTEKAMVHHGFYTAYHNTTLRPAVLNAVETAKELYGDIQIMLTGHSMGGAIAIFCALDLIVNNGAKDVQVMTFGQPRVGNAAFAAYYSKFVPKTIRVTHEHDLVPHLPPYYHYFPRWTYRHFPTEVWLHNVHNGSLIYQIEQVCDGSGEDPTCSRSVMGNSIVDHMCYFDVLMGCDVERKCRIFMDSHLSGYNILDNEGNFVLSRYPSSNISRRNSEPYKYNQDTSMYVSSL